MLASTPINLDGKTFDRYVVNLAVTTKYLFNGEMDISSAIRAIPARVGEEGIELSHEQAKSFVLGDLTMAKQEELEAFLVVRAALEKYLRTKGL